jgi:hypothetical protein
MGFWDDFWGSDSTSSSGSRSRCDHDIENCGGARACTKCGMRWEFKNPNDAGEATITKSDSESWW